MHTLDQLTAQRPPARKTGQVSPLRLRTQGPPMSSSLARPDVM